LRIGFQHVSDPLAEHRMVVRKEYPYRAFKFLTSLGIIICHVARNAS
jgi:hypothetical protein